MCWIALPFSLVLILAAPLVQIPMTVELRDEDRKLVEAEIIFQTLPDRKEIFKAKTNNGSLTLPQEKLPKEGMVILLLITPQDAAKYNPTQERISVAKLKRETVVVVVGGVP